MTFRPPSSIRAALVTGFVGVFGLWLFSGLDLLRSVRDVEDRVRSVHEAFLRGEQTLSAVRTNVLLGSIYLRDALIDSGDVTRQFYRDELHQIRAQIEEQLPAYVPEVELPIERQEWTALQRALTDYWDTLDLLFGPDAPRNYVQGTGLLRRRVVPARDNVLQIVDRISALQRLSAQRQETESSLLYDELRARIVAVGAATILIAGVMALFAFGRVGRLERELDRRRIAEIENRHDLERLSARLVDAQEDERRHLARELHDEVGQALTAIKMEIGVALRAGIADNRARASLDDARSIAEQTLQGVRDLSQFLHPSMLDDFGLPDTLAAYVRSFSTRSGIRAELTHSGLDGRLPAEVEVAVYRIVQEALSNVARHSGASRAVVELARRDDVLHVTVEDNGQGLDPATTPAHRGLGLIAMRERAQALAGQFACENRADGGTRIVVVLPVAGAEGEAPVRLAG
jgi:signal transduction histidine kinase